MKQKENQRIMLTKRLLKETLLRMLSEKDIQMIHVKDLCKEAGINRTTFYNHYGRPSDVLAEIEDELIEGIPAMEPRGKKDEQAFVKQSVLIWQYLYDNRELAKLLLRNNNSESRFAKKIFQFPVIRQALEETVSDFQDLTDKELAITFFENGGYSILRKWIVEDVSKTPEEITELFVRLLSKGCIL
ncbi:MAG: TetR/AcrR family transcriptional regulator [Clostridiales bacterium]|nr:TetR/AcrR family transcriptional regulator [Clostridiales bacterium]